MHPRTKSFLAILWFTSRQITNTTIEWEFYSAYFWNLHYAKLVINSTHLIAVSAGGALKKYEGVFMLGVKNMKLLTDVLWQLVEKMELLAC